MKNVKIKNKVIARLMLLVMIITSILSNAKIVSAAENDMYFSPSIGTMYYLLKHKTLKFPDGQRYQVQSSGADGTANQPIRKMIVRRNGGDKAVFCVEPTVKAETGWHDTSDFNSNVPIVRFRDDKSLHLQEFVSPLTRQERVRIKNIIFWGWDMAKSKNDEKLYTAIQFLVWDAIGWELTDLSSNHITKEYIRSIKNEIDRHSTNTVSFSGRTITLKRGESKTLTDTNGNLQYLGFPDKDGWRLKKNGNSVTITATSNAVNTTFVSNNPKLKNHRKAELLFTQGKSQKLILFNDPNYVDFILNLRVEDDLHHHLKNNQIQ